MPTYTFFDENTGEEFTETMSWEEKKQLLEQCPSVRSVPKSLVIGDPVRLGIKKQSSDFRQILQKTKDAHPRGTINTGNISEI